MREKIISAVGVIAVLAILVGLSPAALSQSVGAGDGFLTRFSGTAGATEPAIDLNGIVGRIIGLRAPRVAPSGQHLQSEPPQLSVTAGDVGQVFGVAFDTAAPPNIYLTATSAFGLHRTSDNTQWMPGMWGEGGGPGTVWKLNAANGYAPEVFATIALNGRENTGPALGNIAFDRWSRQLYVSDLETGMIHRLSLDGTDLGHFDHGTQGRARFTDAQSGQDGALGEVAFDPASAAQISACPAGNFTSHPECWNYADFRRRVWGLAVRRDAATGTVRLYYSVWSSQALGSPGFAGAGDDEKRNAVWSVAIAADGAFDATSVRREFMLPDFFIKPGDIARAGRSHPVSDIAFPQCGPQDTALFSERGGVRNLGLTARAPFTVPHESRVLRYRRDDAGVWRQAGRHDVGFFERAPLGEPHLRANAAGGVAYGFGYGEGWTIDRGQAGAMAWMTGDALCAPDGPCFDPAKGTHDNGAHVDGVQGTAVGAVEEVMPEVALRPYPATGDAAYPAGPNQSFMIDADTAAAGEDGADSDASLVGDVEIYAPCPGDTVVEVPLPEQPGADEALAPDAGGAAADGADGAPLPPPGDGGVAAPLPGPGVGGQPNLAIAKEALGECHPGGICNYTITVTSTGNAAYTDQITVTDPLPAGWTVHGTGPAGGPWNCGQTGNDLVCTQDTPDLAPGAASELTVQLVPPNDIKPGEVENCAELAAVNKRACAKTAVGEGPKGFGEVKGPEAQKQEQPTGTGSWEGPGAKKPDQPTGTGSWEGPGAKPDQPTGTGEWGMEKVRDLSIAKGAPQDAPGAAAGAGMFYVCEPLKPCRFVVTITNTGNQKYTGPVTFKDTIKGSWTYHGVSSGWNCSPDANGFSCTGNVSLEPGQSTKVVVSLNPMPGVPVDPVQGENCAQIVWKDGKGDDKPKNDGPDCMPVTLSVSGPKKPGDPGGGGLPPVETPDIKVTKELVSSCNPGEECTFNITIRGTQDFPMKHGFSLQDGYEDSVFSFAGGGKFGLWNCTTTSTCDYDLKKYPGYPANGFTTSDVLKTEIRLKLSPNAKEGVYKNCVYVEFDYDITTKEKPKSTKIVCALVNVAYKSRVTVTKRFDNPACEPNTPCPFSIIVKNEGKGTYDGIIDVDDQLSPDGAGKYYKRQGITAGGFDCRGLTKYTGIFTPAVPDPRRFRCQTDQPLSPGETRVIRVDGRFSSSAKGKKAFNCAFMRIYSSDASKLSAGDKRILVKRKLRLEGYAASSGTGFTAKDRQALAKYKKDTKHKGADGKPETSGNITDDLVKSLLPKNDDEGETDIPIKACADVSIGTAGLAIKKSGPPASDFRKGQLAKTADALSCQLGGECTFTIEVSASSDAPYTDPITVVESSAKGMWDLVTYSGPGWHCDRKDPFTCTHPPVPGGLTKASNPLRLKLTMKPKFPGKQQAERHPWMHNCAKIQYKDKNRKGPQSCYKFRLVTGEGHYHEVFDYDATGTGNCTPPDCTFYEFTATLRSGPSVLTAATGAAAAADYDPAGTGACTPPNCGASGAPAAERPGYSGPVSMTIKLPAKAEFPRARLTRATSGCPSFGWSCTRSGREFGNMLKCHTNQCRLKPGEQITLRIDGKVAPELTEPPAAEQTRQVCGTLEYQKTSAPGAIEQAVGTERKEACVTTRILAQKPPPFSCPPNEQPVGGRCVCKQGYSRNSAGQCTADRFRYCGPNATYKNGECVCDVGYVRANNQCKKIVCEGGQIRRGDNQCVCLNGLVRKQINAWTFRCEPPVCATGTTWHPRFQRCLPTCVAPFVLNQALTGCVCPQGLVQRGDQCVRARYCDPGHRYDQRLKTCVPICTSGTAWNNRLRRCVPLCAAPFVPNRTLTGCVCPSNLVRRGNTCVRPIRCVSPFVPNASGTACVCPRNLTRQGNTCVRPCGAGTRWDARYRRCVPVCRAPFVLNKAATGCVCRRGLVRKGNSCIRPCRGNTRWSARYQRCIPECRRPFVLNRTLTGCVCRGNLIRRGNRCVKPKVCTPPMRLNRAGTKCLPPDCRRGTRWNARYKRCIPVCRGGQVLRGLRCVCPSNRPAFIRGKCVTVTVVPPRTKTGPSKPKRQPTLKMKPIQGGVLCPKGQRWVKRLGRCVRRVK